MPTDPEDKLTRKSGVRANWVIAGAAVATLLLGYVAFPAKESKATYSGSILGSPSNKPIAGARLQLVGTPCTVTTSLDGYFDFAQCSQASIVTRPRVLITLPGKKQPCPYQASLVASPTSSVISVGSNCESATEIAEIAPGSDASAMVENAKLVDSPQSSAIAVGSDCALTTEVAKNDPGRDASAKAAVAKSAPDRDNSAMAEISLPKASSVPPISSHGSERTAARVARGAPSSPIEKRTAARAARGMPSSSIQEPLYDPKICLMGKSATFSPNWTEATQAIIKYYNDLNSGGSKKNEYRPSGVTRHVRLLKPLRPSLYTFSMLPDSLRFSDYTTAVFIEYAEDSKTSPAVSGGLATCVRITLNEAGKLTSFDQFRFVPKTGSSALPRIIRPYPSGF